jgi:Cft2 family RNA processing exonuclease
MNVVIGEPQEGWRETRSQDLTAGDIVQVNDAQQIPADMVLISSSHPKGSCYITTANLDGCVHVWPIVATVATIFIFFITFTSLYPFRRTKIVSIVLTTASDGCVMCRQ